MKEENIYNYCHIAGRTDIGCKRQANEDSMGDFETLNGLAAVVCDGMGGHVGGAIASRIAVEVIHDFLDKQLYEDPREAIGEAIDAANKAILHQAMIQPELQGMGSTCVLLLVRDSKVYIGHVGDSRIYLIRNRRIKQLTKDHSYVQMLVDTGRLTYEQAEHHPRKNEITNALGIATMKPATVQPDAIMPEAGDCFLLCSDGLSGMVPDAEIERIVSRQSEMRSQERVDYLVQRARDSGGLDNITVEIVEFSITPHSPPKIKSKKTGLSILAAVILLCIGAGGGYYFWDKHFKSESSAVDNNSQSPTQRKTTVIKLPETKFRKGGTILDIKYGQGFTEIFMGHKSVKRISQSLSSDSLKHEGKDIDASYDNRLLTFRQKFEGEQLSFSLSDSTTIFRFVVPVVQDATVVQIVKLPHEKPKDTANISKDNNISAANLVGEKAEKSLHDISIQFDSKGGEIITFTGGKGAHFTVEGGNRYALNWNFDIEDVIFNENYFRVDKTPDGVYVISSIENRIPEEDKVDIIFEGRVIDENKNPVLHNICLCIKVKKGE